MLYPLCPVRLLECHRESQVGFRLHTLRQHVHTYVSNCVTFFSSREPETEQRYFCDPAPPTLKPYTRVIFAGSFLCNIIICWQDVMNIFLGLFRGLDEVYRT